VSSSWPVWLIGCVVLLVAGLATALVPRWRARKQVREAGWLAAHAAIDSATVSRDAATTRSVEAEQMLARAEAISSGRGGRAAAHEAASLARRADQLWRAADGG
jgi:hypothetical protein